jgi:hypothetical protein
MRHANILGCILLLLLAFRLKSDPRGSVAENQKPVIVICQIFVSLGIIATIGHFLWQQVSQELQQRKRQEWVTNSQIYAEGALIELHKREPKGAFFLTDTFDGAYAQKELGYKLRPLIDTGLSRYSNETVKFFFYLDNQPAAPRATFDNSQGALEVVAQKAEGRYPVAVGAYYTMGFLSPYTTLTLLSRTADPWWKEPNINFLLEWLKSVPVASLQEAMADLSPQNPSQLRLRILLALRLGLIQ